MVVSTAKQLPATYQLWRRFSFPTKHGSVSAVAVPNWVANQLNAAYATMISLMMIHFWSIVIGAVVYFFLRKNKLKIHGLHGLAPALWNKRADLLDSMMETFNYARDDWKTLWLYGLLVLILVAWVGQTAMGILVPPLIIAGYAAPVDPNAIYIPEDTIEDDSVVATRFALEVPWALRALGSANLENEDVSKKVRVSHAVQLGERDNGEKILRIDYGYRVTGTDFGLQHHTDLALDVTGSCVTEYGWLQRTDVVPSTQVLVDSYQVFDNPSLVQISLSQGLQPVAFFYLGSNTNGTLDTSNATWAVLISSVNRTSFSPGADPWYLTNPGTSEAAYTVRNARPALSCWQDDVWSYKGRNTTVVELGPVDFPSLALSEGLQTIFARYLTEPMIRQVGSRLGASALLSSTTSVGQIFDAASSSIHNDLERLVLAAYIATTNILTDSTLYPAGADRDVPNAALGDGQILDGLADFVVWTSEATALSLSVIIAIPSVLVGIWVLAILMLYWTPVKIVNGLDSNDMYEKLRDTHPGAVLVYDEKEGGAWKL